MSMYDDPRKDDVYNEIKWYLEEHPLSELLQIIADVIEYEVEREK